MARAAKALSTGSGFRTTAGARKLLGPMTDAERAYVVRWAAAQARIHALGSQIERCTRRTGRRDEPQVAEVQSLARKVTTVAKEECDARMRRFTVVAFGVAAMGSPALSGW